MSAGESAGHNFSGGEPEHQGAGYRHCRHRQAAEPSVRRLSPAAVLGDLAVDLLYSLHLGPLVSAGLDNLHALDTGVQVAREPGAPVTEVAAGLLEPRVQIPEDEVIDRYDQHHGEPHPPVEEDQDAEYSHCEQQVLRGLHDTV